MTGFSFGMTLTEVEKNVPVKPDRPAAPHKGAWIEQLFDVSHAILHTDVSSLKRYQWGNDVVLVTFDEQDRVIGKTYSVRGMPISYWIRARLPFLPPPPAPAPVMWSE